MRYQATYKVTRAMSLEGSRPARSGDTEITEWVQVRFVPNGVVDTDIDLGTWVNEGYLIVIQDAPVPVSVPDPVPIPVPEPEPIPEPEPEPEPESEPEEEDEPDTDEESSGADYEGMDGGGYRCLHCGKAYKPGPRSLAFIEDHVEREHK